MKTLRDIVYDSAEKSVRIFVWKSVFRFVYKSVENSVWDSVWVSVWDSVWNSTGKCVRDSVSISALNKFKELSK